MNEPKRLEIHHDPADPSHVVCVTAIRRGKQWQAWCEIHDFHVRISFISEAVADQAFALLIAAHWAESKES